MKINLYDYQQKFYDDIINSINKGNNKPCGVLPTGGGKSVIIGKIANNLPGRNLILTHRIEILTQNSDWIENSSLLSSKINTLKYNCKTVVAMVQTLDARIKKYGIEYIGHIDNIILDEVHIDIFKKVFQKYDYKLLIGLTATPVSNKKIYSEIDGIEFVEPYTLSVMFNDLIQGPDTQDLIDLGKLVQDYNITLNLPDFDKLKESETAPDGYTRKSLDEVYVNTASIKILSEAYDKYCKGKKTLIFNASAKVNKFVYDTFKKKGLNVKMFDSVSSAEINPETGKKFKREEIIKWFENERDAILINVNVFTTGFNVTDVECVIVNRATKSLSLWLQMVGRGSRTTTKILKDYFTVIDLGQNIHNHGPWSKRRDWKQYFYSPGKKRKKSLDLLQIWECNFCGAYNIKGEVVCEECGKEKTTIQTSSNRKHKEGELVELNKMPLPKAKPIIEYTIKLNKTSTFAFKVLEQRILDLFIYYKVSKSYYQNKKEDFVDENGNKREGFKSRVKKMYLPIYFAIIKSVEKFDMQAGSNKKLETMLNRMYEKIEKLYE